MNESRTGEASAGDVSIYVSSDGIGKCYKIKHILHHIDLLLGYLAFNLNTCGNNVFLDILRGGCIGLVLVHMTLIDSNGARQMVLDQHWSEAGDVGELSLWSSAPRSVDDG